MQAEEKDYFKLLAYNLFSYVSDSDFKDSYKKKYGLTDEQYSNQCHMFLTKISQGYPFNKDENNKKTRRYDCQFRYFQGCASFLYYRISFQD